MKTFYFTVFIFRTIQNSFSLVNKFIILIRMYAILYEYIHVILEGRATPKIHKHKHFDKKLNLENNILFGYLF